MSNDSTRTIAGISTPNLILIAVGLIGAVVLAVTGQLVGAAAIVFGCVFIYLTARRARSAGSDVTRLHTAELVDERDRALFTRVMATVGVVALTTTFAGWVIVMLLLDPFTLGWTVLTVLVLIQAATWLIASAVVARRG